VHLKNRHPMTGKWANIIDNERIYADERQVWHKNWD
jgi:hypothetical protein